MKNDMMKLTMENFRGATKPCSIELDLNKEITFIFGENGSGKSSIVDALSFLFLGDSGSLAEISGAGFSDLVTIGKSNSDVKVTVDYQGKRLQRKMKGKNAGDLTGAVPFNMGVLRRSQILKLVASKPAERYNAVKEFFEIPNVQKAEDNLRSAFTDKKKEFNSSVERKSSTEQELFQLWEQAGSPNGDCGLWAENQSAIDLSSQRQLQTQYNDVSSALSLVSEEKDSWIEKRDDTITKANLLREAETALTNAREKADAGKEQLLEVLQKASEFFEKNQDVKACPVCGNIIDTTKVSKGIKDQIQSMEALSKALKSVSSQKRALEISQKAKQLQVNKLLQGMVKAFDAITALIGNSDIHEGISAIASHLHILLKTITSENEEITDEQIDHVFEQLAHAQWEMKTEKVRQAIDKTIQSHDLIADKFEKLKLSKVESQKAEIQVQRIEQALKIYEDKRKAYISGILDAISNDVNRLYQIIHPGENIGNLQFVIHDNRKGSLDLSAQFHTRQEVKPQAYYSESHLDTLGICIFVALAKKYEHEAIILDDVLTSVDSAHFERFIDLIDQLASEFKKIIMTSHSRSWKERYQQHQAANQKVQVIELNSLWSPNNGIRAIEVTPDLDTLKTLISDKYFDRQRIASKAGIILECIFDKIALVYQLRLPRKKRNDFTLVEYLSAIPKRLKEVWRIEFDEKDGQANSIDLKPLFDAIYDMNWIRNQVGAHFNTSEQEVSDHDVEDFAKKTIAFADALICAESSELPLRDGNSFWTTKSKKKRMYPYSIPR